MAVLTDLHSLDTTATRLDQQATELRSRANLLRAATESLHWQSIAANAFEQHCADTCTRLRQAADRLDHAAFVLRRHAATARGRIDAAEQFTVGAVDLAGDAVGLIPF